MVVILEFGWFCVIVLLVLVFAFNFAYLMVGLLILAFFGFWCFDTLGVGLV